MIASRVFAVLAGALCSFAAIRSYAAENVPNPSRSSGDESRKVAAHQWSLSDRIAARTDPSLARVRAGQGRNGVRASAWTDVINGSRNPELFLPTELLDSLIRRGYLGEPAWREILAPDIADLGLPPNFWEELEIVAASYLDVMRKKHAIALRGRDHPELRIEAKREIAKVAANLCRDRAAALRAARAHFGPAFEQLLYMSIAPGLVISTNDPLDPLRLQAREDGCS
jgi:hypothetical protein